MPSNHLILYHPFSSCPQSFPASGSFPMIWLITSGNQSIGASASASVLPMNIQGWFPLGLTGLTSLLSKGLSRVFSNTVVQKHQFFSTQSSLWSNSHISLYISLNKTKTTRNWMLQWLQSECYGGLCWAQIWVWGTGETSCPKQMRMKWVSWESPPPRKGDLGLTSDTRQLYKKVRFWIQLFS